MKRRRSPLRIIVYVGSFLTWNRIHRLHRQSRDTISCKEGAELYNSELGHTPPPPQSSLATLDDPVCTWTGGQWGLWSGRLEVMGAGHNWPWGYKNYIIHEWPHWSQIKISLRQNPDKLIPIVKKVFPLLQFHVWHVLFLLNITKHIYLGDKVFQIFCITQCVLYGLL